MFEWFALAQQIAEDLFEITHKIQWDLELQLQATLFSGAINCRESSRLTSVREVAEPPSAAHFVHSAA